MMFSGDHTAALTKMKELVATLKRRNEHRELVMLALRRGFTLDLLTRAFCMQVKMDQEHGNELLPLPDFFKAVNEGKYDFLLKDDPFRAVSQLKCFERVEVVLS
jgi:GGDEF domain-containing protein